MAILVNPRHEVYCQERAKGLNKAQAARNAGFSERTAGVSACRLEKRPEIKDRIRELSDRATAQAVAEVSISREYVIGKLVAIVEKCTSETHYAPAAANKSLELLGKAVDLFNSVPIELFNLALAQMGAAVAKYVTDEETIQRIAAEWEKIALTRKVKTGEKETQAQVM